MCTRFNKFLCNPSQDFICEMSENKESNFIFDKFFFFSHFHIATYNWDKHGSWQDFGWVINCCCFFVRVVLYSTFQFVRVWILKSGFISLSHTNNNRKKKIQPVLSVIVAILWHLMLILLVCTFHVIRISILWVNKIYIKINVRRVNMLLLFFSSFIINTFTAHSRRKENSRMKNEVYCRNGHLVLSVFLSFSISIYLSLAFAFTIAIFICNVCYKWIFLYCKKAVEFWRKSARLGVSKKLQNKIWQCRV